MLQQVKKRNGEIVEFSLEKIATAIKNAFAATETSFSDDLIQRITRNAEKDLEQLAAQNGTPTVEDVQNSVELSLMKEGLYKVAKAYIIYRFQHTKMREQKHQEVLKKIEEDTFFVVKRNGEKEKFSLDKLKGALYHATVGFEALVDIDALARECQHDLYEGITTDEVEKALILVVRAHIEEDPAYSKIAARLLLSKLNKETIGTDSINFANIDAEYRMAFIENLKRGVEIKRLNPELLSYNLDTISQALILERDDELMYLGLQTMYDRYFMRNPETGRVLESVQGFWMRVAMGLALNEKPEEREAYAIKFYNLVSNLRFVPSTPTLFHSGTAHPQLSSCYLTTVDDSLEHIFKCIGDNAQLSKWSGGLGNDWTNIRGTGSLIRGTGVKSQGVIPFLKIANDTTVAINRSGRRRGATCAYLETWHLDIEDFVELRRNTGDERRRTHDMNTSHWIPDLFMKRVIENREWTLFSPSDVPDLHHIYGKDFEKRYEHYEQMVEAGEITHFKKVKAMDLWKKMISMLFETGHPWITFKDPCNVRSPQDHAGVIHSSNLCTEITLNTSAEETAVCNLGSVNMSRHVVNGMFDMERIEETVTTAMRMLDNVIDINFYPTKEAKNSNLKHRPVGLGVMGFQDALYKLNIKFASEDAVEFADSSMEAISYYVILASAMLAKERGTYSSYKGSKWDRNLFPIDTIGLLEQERGVELPVSKKTRLDWNVVRDAVKQYGMRNSNCMAVAPTATISNIAGCFPTIEPIYKNIYVKSNMSGEFTITNHYLIDDLKERNLWTPELLKDIKDQDGNIQNVDTIPVDLKEKYQEAFDIDSEWFIKIAAARGKWIDQSQSLNMFIRGTSGRKISDTYLYAWKMGLKTTYYLRSLAATGIEKSTSRLAKQEKRPESLAKPAADVVSNSTAAAPTPPPAPVASKQPAANLSRIEEPSCEACQ